MSDEIEKVGYPPSEIDPPFKSTLLTTTLRIPMPKGAGIPRGWAEPAADAPPSGSGTADKDRSQ